MIRHFLWTVWPCENVDRGSPNLYDNLFIISPGFISEEVPPILVQLCFRMGNNFTLSCMQFNSIFKYQKLSVQCVSLLGNQSYVTAQHEWQPVSQLPHVVFCNEPWHVQNYNTWLPKSCITTSEDLTTMTTMMNYVSYIQPYSIVPAYHMKKNPL